MVWAISEPTNIGRFFPSGTYIGRKEQIRAYYESMSEQQKAAHSEQGSMSLPKFSKKYLYDLGPMAPQECPGHFDIAREPETLGDLIMTENQLLAVSAPLKEVIERVEPDVHQFWPMRITLAKCTVEWPEPYFGLRIGRFLDAFVPGEGAYHRGDARYGYSLYYVKNNNRQGYADLKFSGARLANAHLWRERHLRDPNILISDALQAAISEAGLRIMKHYRVKTVATEEAG